MGGWTGTYEDAEPSEQGDGRGGLGMHLHHGERTTKPGRRRKERAVGTSTGAETHVGGGVLWMRGRLLLLP